MPQYKALHDTQIAKALEAHKVDDVEAYLVATKVHLAAIAGQNVVWSLAARSSGANELG
ncbi:DUF3034 family protein [Pseudoalteromonas sp.]|uniref:DUF3034 family protein n=1 Tax=Pseudoalteromonas sp. TaxID=53249 RepID=UPI00345D45A6|nr:DUF3034 family protein [Pseudoalteromonas sp.]MCP4585575.1 DUF3034 family protein [Pseudoalteromonas sp.]